MRPPYDHEAQQRTTERHSLALCVGQPEVGGRSPWSQTVCRGDLALSPRGLTYLSEGIFSYTGSYSRRPWNQNPVPIIGDN
jgi:hypothetical protein